MAGPFGLFATVSVQVSMLSPTEALGIRGKMVVLAGVHGPGYRPLPMVSRIAQQDKNDNICSPVER